jgi:hypothetical protein
MLGAWGIIPVAVAEAELHLAFGEEPSVASGGGWVVVVYDPPIGRADGRFWATTGLLGGRYGSRLAAEFRRTASGSVRMAVEHASDDRYQRLASDRR